MRRLNNKQVEMFLAMEPRVLRGESDKFYSAVQFLRRLGHQVLRVGPNQSRIGDRLVGRRGLMVVAKSLGWAW